MVGSAVATDRLVERGEEHREQDAG